MDAFGVKIFMERDTEDEKERGKRKKKEKGEEKYCASTEKISNSLFPLDVDWPICLIKWRECTFKPTLNNFN